MTHRRRFPIFFAVFAALILVLGVNAYRRPSSGPMQAPEPLPEISAEIAGMPHAVQIFSDVHLALRKLKASTTPGQWFQSGYLPGDLLSNLADLNEPEAWTIFCKILDTLPDEDMVALEPAAHDSKFGSKLRCASSIASRAKRFQQQQNAKLRSKRPIRFASKRLEVIERVATSPDMALAPGEANLSFNEGPDPKTTTRLLDVLKKEGVRANFFPVGSEARERPQLLHQIEKNGHVVGSHTQYHPALLSIAMRDAEECIAEGRETLETILGHSVSLFRFPFNESNGPLSAVIDRRSMTSVPWDIDSRDWQASSASMVVDNVIAELDRVRGGRIAFSEGSEQALEALPYILDELKARGFKIIVITSR